MKIKVVEITEHENGDATVVFDMCPDAVRTLLELGIITAIKNGIERSEPRLSDEE